MDLPCGRDSPHAGRLVGWLEYNSAGLRHAAVPKRKPPKRRPHYAPPQTPGMILAGIPEMARRYLSEAILRYDRAFVLVVLGTGADPRGLATWR